MALYELSDKDINNIRALIMKAQITGAEAMTVVQILARLQMPVKSKKPDTPKMPTNKVDGKDKKDGK